MSSSSLVTNEAHAEVLYWLQASSIQLDRTRIAFSEVITSSRNAQSKAVRSTDIRKIGIASGVSYEAHFLVISLNNLATALSSSELPQALKSMGFSSIQVSQIRALRHNYEHWSEKKPEFLSKHYTRAAAEYVALSPHGKPWNMALDEESYRLGDLLDINEIQSVIMQLENYTDPPGEPRSS